MTRRLSTRFLALALLAIGLSACSHFSKQESNRVLFDEVIVVNQTDRQIKDFKVMNTVTHRYFGCSLILPNASCSIAFTKRAGQNHPIRIAWVQRGTQIEESLATEFIHSDRVIKKVYIDLLPDGKFTSQIR